MSYSRWGNGSEWYIFWQIGDATCADDELLAVWHVEERNNLPQYSYAALRSDRELVWQDITGRVPHANREIFDSAVDAFLEDVETEYAGHAVTDAVRGHATELGIPEWLAWLEKAVFEGLPEEQARQWSVRFSQALPVGTDLEPVQWSFCAFLLGRTIERVRAAVIDEGLKEQVLAAIGGVLKLHEQAIETGVWDTSAAESAWLATSIGWRGWREWRAGMQALAVARQLAGKSVARSGVGPTFVAMAARFTAESATQSAGESVTIAAEYELYADKLVELLVATN